jgi:hypothetical protein
MKNNYVKPFSIFNESLEESVSAGSNWYYGIADCHGLESFMKEPDLADADKLDRLHRLGLASHGSKDDPIKKEYGGNLAMMQMRCRFNGQRHPVVYRAKLSEEDADMVQDLLDSGDYINALNVVKGNSEEVQLARGGNGSAEKAWKMIPNPDLDPMYN